jgi:glutamate-1-semialdehyde 2,1-aminomutase
MKTYSQSQQLFERAQDVLAGGVSSEFRKMSHPHPLFYTRAQGSRLWDVDNNEYLDFTLSQGPLILGHSRAEVLQAVASESQKGQLFAGQHLQELELAEFLQRVIPCAELMRFSLSGSECDHAAIRLARAATGRQKFIRFEGHYHGWFDNVALGISGANEESLGPRESPTPVPWTQGLPDRVDEEMIVLPWNDISLLEATLQKHAHEIAAIITEPVMCNNGCIAPRAGFLQGIRELCDRYGIVFILDEVITGFRLGLGGAQKYFGITPDLGIFGKAMANGYPIAVLAGKRVFGPDKKPLMQLVAEGKVIHAGTMNSCNPCVAAALTTLQILEDEDVHPRLFHLGQAFMKGLRDAARAAGHDDFLIQGLGPMFHIGFTPLKEVSDYRECLSYDKTKLSRFVALMAEHGVRLIGRGLVYISAAHTPKDIEAGVETAHRVLVQMKNEEHLSGVSNSSVNGFSANGRLKRHSDETADVLTPDGAATPISAQEATS